MPPLPLPSLQPPHFLLLQGEVFISDTDTESIAKLIGFIYKTKMANKEACSFRQLVEETVSQLEGAYALIFKSVHFPGEVGL